MDANNRPALHTLLEQGQTASDELRLEQALETYQTAAEAYPEAVEPLIRLARTLSRMRRSDESMEAIERGLSVAPGNLELLTIKGSLLFLLDRNDEAIEMLKSVVEAGGNDPEAHVVLAQALADQREHEESQQELTRAEALIDAIEDATERERWLAMLWHARTYTHLAKGNNEEAMASAQEVIARKDANPYAACLAYSNLGILQMRGRKYDLAISYLQEALDLNPYFHRAGHALGRLYIVRKRYAEAVETLQRVVESTHEPSAGVRFALASALSKNGQRKEALAEYRAALAAGLSGINAVNARLQMIWLSEVGRYSIIAILMAAVLAYIVLGQPSTQTLTFIALLVVLIVLQRTVGRRRS